MKTLLIPSSGIVVADAGLSMSSDLLLLRPESFFRRSRKFVRAGFLHLAPARHRNIQPIFSLSSDPQVDLETADNKDQEICQLKTVNVKFQIQKECAFGDELLLVGDDPMFGLWDPDNGVPLTWSEGHIWAVKMNMPVRKTIQFKFILKASTGIITWQSGPDRTFQSWETNNTITVCEDWEDAEQQKLIEDDGYPSPNQNEDFTANSEVLVVAETSNRSSIEESGSISSKETTTTAMVADNIGNPKKGSVVNVVDEKENVAIPNKGKVTRKDAVGKISTVGVSDEPNNAKDSTVPELEKKQEFGSETLINEEEDQASLEQQPLSAKARNVANEEEELKQGALFVIEEQASSAPNSNEVIVNDIQWGRRALQKLLANFGLGLG